MNALIIDNEKMPAKHLENMITRHCPQIKKRKIINKPTEALLYLKKNQTDVIFLDIEMPEMNAFEFLEIGGLENMPPIIFTTAYSKYAVKAFKVRAVDYLLKPIDSEDLIAAVHRLNEGVSDQQEEKLAAIVENPPADSNDRLVLANNQYYHFALPEEIVRVEGNGSYSQFYLTDGRKIMTSKHLKSYTQRLLKKGFIRSHQSHLVNKQYIEGFSKADGGELIVKDGHRVPVSTRLRSNILDLLGLR